MNKKYQTTLAMVALLGNFSVKEIEAMSLKAKESTCANYADEWDAWDDLPADEPAPSTDKEIKPSTKRRGCKKCKKDCWDSCDEDSDDSHDCCPCTEEFDEVHCGIDDLCHKICDVQENQEDHSACLGIIKGKLDDIQGGIDEIIDEIGGLGGGNGGNGGNGGVGGNGGTNGCLVCINCGGTCCCNGDGDGNCCCCCCDGDCNGGVEPPGGGIDPDPTCLIGGGGNGIENGDLIELWFSAKTKSCTRDFYFGSSSFNWLGDNSCGQTGFHGEATGTPGVDVVSQATFYVKRNNLIPGLYEATTWQYDTTEVDLVNADFEPGLGLEFEGAQLVDSEGLCLSRGENPIDD
jgi:hypothetical protein